VPGKHLPDTWALRSRPDHLSCSILRVLGAGLHSTGHRVLAEHCWIRRWICCYRLAQFAVPSLRRCPANNGTGAASSHSRYQQYRSFCFRLFCTRCLVEMKVAEMPLACMSSSLEDKSLCWTGTDDFHLMASFLCTRCNCIRHIWHALCFCAGFHSLRDRPVSGHHPLQVARCWTCEARSPLVGPQSSDWVFKGF
jgi:hypothetical protein